MPTDRRGVLLGAAAYTMWGLFPLYFPQLKPASAGEILAHRVLWSFVLVVLILLGMRGVRSFFGVWRERRSRWVLLGAGAAIACNWFTYIWAVNNDHVVEAALGYYINPLVTVTFGVVLLRERLRPMQWTAVSIGVVAVLVLSIGHGRPPWVSLILAGSFGTYGLLKKKAVAVPALHSVGWEAMVLSPFGLGFLLWLSLTGHGTTASLGPWHFFLLSTTGVATVVPLVCFAAAAHRIPLSLVGLLQYITPTLQFLCGVVIFSEPMPPARWAGFFLIWVALALLSADSLATLREVRRLALQRRGKSATPTTP